jgi:type II secretory ATPase GspE/PulE/Tfp pilus assembly ATPase PilB-like protein
MMIMDDKIRESIDSKHFSFDETRNIAEHQPGFVSLREAGAQLVAQGVTSIEEFDHLINIMDIDEKLEANKKEHEQKEETEKQKD